MVFARQESQNKFKLQMAAKVLEHLTFICECDLKKKSLSSVQRIAFCCYSENSWIKNGTCAVSWTGQV